MDSAYPLVPVANIIAFFMMLPILSLRPLRQSCNLGVSAMAAWISVCSLLIAIQTVIWRDNADTSIAPIFCDISTHFQVGFTAATPTCAFMISRCLYLVVKHQAFESSNSLSMPLRLFLLLGLPIIMNIQYYLVQNSRFVVYEQYGCMPSVQPSGLYIIIVSYIPMASISVSIYYLVFIAMTLWKHKRRMSHLFISQTAITRPVFLRILAFGLILLIYSGAFIANLFPLPSAFYQGWAAIHDDWDPVAVSAAEWQTSSLNRVTMVWDEWVNVVLAVVVFGLFGLTHDAREAYKRTFHGILGRFGRLRSRQPQASSPLIDVVESFDTSGFSCVPTPNLTPTTNVSCTAAEVDPIEIAVTVEQHTKGDTDSQIAFDLKREKCDEIKAVLVV